MKQRLFSLMLVIVANMGLVSAQNTSGKCGDNLIWKISLTDYSLTISGTGNMTSYSVDNSSPWPNNITSVIIENGVSSIGDYAFYDCSKITSITIPNSITSIGDRAFYNCRGLTSITIPNSVTSIGRGTFFGCSSLPVIDNIRYADTYIVEAVDKTLSTYNIKEGTKWIEYYAFNRCSSLTSITIPNSVISIGEGAFEFCSSLTSVTIPSSVTSIGKKAFYDCSSLTSVNIPSSVTSIGDNAFYDCSSLTSVTIPSSITSIGEGAFSNCKINKIDFNGTIEEWCNKSWSHTRLLHINSSPYYAQYAPFSLYINGTILTDLAIPNSVTTIGECAFIVCSSLTSVTIPNSVTSIGNGAFEGCTSLTSITIPNSVTSIGERAFYECSSLPVIDNIRYADTYLVEAADKTLSTYNIKEGTKWIGTRAFDSCHELANITIPNSVKSIENYAFDSNRLSSITIPSSVTSIGDEAFPSINNLKSVILNSAAVVSKAYEPNYSLVNIFGYRVTEYIIGDSVTAIGQYAFSYCRGLTSVTIPSSVTSIGNYAFQNCSSLTSVTIGNSVTSIGDFAFTNCSGLTSITSEAVTPAVCQEYTFYDVDKSIPLYVPNGRVEAYKAAYGWKDFYNIQAISPTPSAIEETLQSASSSINANGDTRKVFENGQLYILLPDNTRYNLQGMEVK